MRTRSALVPGIALAILALTACSPGGDGGSGGGDGGSGGGDGGGSAGGVAECLTGVWALDVDDLAGQLADYLTENGVAITGSAAEGSVSLSLADGEAIYDSDVTYTLDADMRGIPLTIAQAQVGQSSGGWAVEGDGVVYDGWRTGVEITTTVSMGGEAADLPVDLPDTTGSGVATATTCSGDAMTTHPEGSPFTQRWSRAG